MYGWSYQQILAHYYGGTTLGTLPSPEPDITVHLLELDGHNTIASSDDGAQLVATWTGATPVAAPAFEVTSSGGTQSVYSGPSCCRSVAARRDHLGVGDDSQCTDPGRAPHKRPASPVPSCKPVSRASAHGCTRETLLPRRTAKPRTSCPWRTTWTGSCQPSHRRRGRILVGKRPSRPRRWQPVVTCWRSSRPPASSATPRPARCTPGSRTSTG